MGNANVRKMMEGDDKASAKLFKQLDKDGSGTLDREELGELVRLMWEHYFPTNEKALTEEMINEFQPMYQDQCREGVEQGDTLVKGLIARNTLAEKAIPGIVKDLLFCLDFEEDGSLSFEEWEAQEDLLAAIILLNQERMPYDDISLCHNLLSTPRADEQLRVLWLYYSRHTGFNPVPLDDAGLIPGLRNIEEPAEFGVILARYLAGEDYIKDSIHAIKATGIGIGIDFGKKYGMEMDVDQFVEALLSEDFDPWLKAAVAARSPQNLK